MREPGPLTIEKARPASCAARCASARSSASLGACGQPEGDGVGPWPFAGTGGTRRRKLVQLGNCQAHPLARTWAAARHAQAPAG